MGFDDVYDYVAGKLDWLAAGLPTEGRNAGRPRARTVARQDVPTCRLEDRVGDVADRVRQAGWDACVVTNEERVVFGLLREQELSSDQDGRIQAVMRAGPSTFRPHVSIDEMARFMVNHDLASALITTSDGRLVGLLRSDDAVAATPKDEHRHGEEEDE